MQPVSQSTIDFLRSRIRDVPDFPRPGIVFKDVTPLLKDGKAFAESIRALGSQIPAGRIDAVVGIESRGFIFAAALALKMETNLILVRKPKKLPFRTVRVEYELEYGKDSLEMHVDAVAPGDNILVVDDVLATGGTARATAQLVEQMGGKVVGMAFLIELEFLTGREKIKSYPVVSLLRF